MELGRYKNMGSLQDAEVGKIEVLIKMFEDCHPSKNNAIPKSHVFNICKPNANEKFY